MATIGKRTGSAPAAAAAGTGGNGKSGDLTRLLRYSHIFSSTVRDLLETRLLQEVSQDPLSVSQLHLLKLMMFNGHHQAGQVASFLGVSPPAATKNIDKLEGLGLLARTPDKVDRRATLLSITAKGRRLVRKFEEKKAERLEPVLHGFDREELSAFSNMLERFSVSLLDLDPADEGVCLRCSAYLEARCPVGRVRGGCPYQKNRKEEGTG